MIIYTSVKYQRERERERGGNINPVKQYTPYIMFQSRDSCMFYSVLKRIVTGLAIEVPSKYLLPISIVIIYMYHDVTI